MQIPEEFDSTLATNPNASPEQAGLASRILDVGIALMVWLATLFLLIFVPLVFLFPYAIRRGISPGSADFVKNLTEFALKDPTAIFLQVLATLPTHIVTFVLVWAVVTRFGKRPFWESINWGWGRYLNLWSCIALGVGLFLASSAVAHFLGGDKPTQLDQILNSSPAAKYLIAFLATFTAPFAEEFVYRGLLYSSLQRLIGKVGAVILVLGLFTFVHVPQYLPNYGVIAAVGLLSIVLTIVRAVSNRLLPCVVIHLVFNGIQSALIVAGFSGTKPEVTPQQVTSIIQPLVHFFHFLV